MATQSTQIDEQKYTSPDAPAFARAAAEWTEDHGNGTFAQDGITFREYVAVKLMAGMLANPDREYTSVVTDSIALYAVHAADALIAELRKGKP